MTAERRHVGQSFETVRGSIGSKIAALLPACALFSIGCGASPTQPTRQTASSPQSTSIGMATWAPAEVVTAQAAAALTPSDLVAHGWTCRQTPVPPIQISCSRPNQDFPSAATPPADRPATYTLLMFELDGTFVGLLTFVRADLYSGQLCESTGEPYIFRSLIDYYTCLRTIGG